MVISYKILPRNNLIRAADVAQYNLNTSATGKEKH